MFTFHVHFSPSIWTASEHGQLELLCQSADFTASSSQQQNLFSYHPTKKLQQIIRTTDTKEEVRHTIVIADAKRLHLGEAKHVVPSVAILTVSEKQGYYN